MSKLLKTTKKSKFSKIVWFLEPEEEIRVKQKINNYSNSIFTKSFDDFKNQINQETFNIFSISKANNLEKLLEVIHSFSEYTFYEVGWSDLSVSVKESFLECEGNVKRLMWLNDIIEEIKMVEPNIL
jgi:hypothetical protein